MKTFYINETRKDFLENWKSIKNELEIPKFGVPQELKFYEKMAEHNKLGLFISNSIELRMEYVNVQYIAHYFKHKEQKLLLNGFNYSWQQTPSEYLDFCIQGYRKILLNAMNRCKPEDSIKVEAFMDFPYKLSENKSEYFRLLQHFKILQADKTFKPVFLMNICSDITYFKKKDDVSLAIKMPDGIVNFYKFNVYTKTVSDFGFLSIREISILQLLSRCLSSRQIADILFISPNTVDTHRRNMLEMTNCVDTTALIVYCRMLGIY
jgi:DNA-binding CsgD family transcriptional regulator